ncbi:MAG: hypothetical protein LBL71_01945 [Endomicrobium sp.]|nr:hypothetical protein [Endomicrobium sp.]
MKKYNTYYCANEADATRLLQFLLNGQQVVATDGLYQLIRFNTDDENILTRGRREHLSEIERHLSQQGLMLAKRDNRWTVIVLLQGTLFNGAQNGARMIILSDNFIARIVLFSRTHSNLSSNLQMGIERLKIDFKKSGVD